MNRAPINRASINRAPTNRAPLIRAPITRGTINTALVKYHQSELLASSTRREQVVSIVSLYKALGGGWATEDEISEAGSFIEATLPPD